MHFITNDKFSVQAYLPDNSLNPNIPLYNTRMDWLPYGDLNDYPNLLTDLLMKSSIHKAIQYGKWELSQGGGLTWDDIDENDRASKIKMNKLFYSANSQETLNEVFDKIIFDYIIFGGYCFEVIWSKDREQISQIHHIPFNFIRKGRPAGNATNITSYWYSEDWSNYRRKSYQPQEIPAFDRSQNKNEPRQLVWYKDYNPGELYYPTPQYVAAIPYALIDFEIAKYHLNDILNGLSPDYILALNSGEPLREEKQQFEFDLKNNFTGSNGKKIMITYSDDKEHSPEIIPIQIQDPHMRFITLNEAVIQNLMTSNRLTSPMLMGIKTEGQLGGSTEMSEAFDIYYNTVIQKIQKNVLLSLNKLLFINGIMTEFSVIKPQLVSNKISESMLEKISTINELRKMSGMEDHPDVNKGDQSLNN